ncbi:hypothetical protein PAPYR_9877 [Paratrimastix pyriformis]|uniref:Uncharacterized protein n=1 Tax=Paratrimastix pyriformis TaxID=342808 RepID=A0ABQ8UBE2_9EUKA|nr:hypothetical protein PAPYR_9877 [Paratrimastix pyriformis]
MEICSENDDLDGDVSNFVMMHAEIKRNDDPFLRFLNRDISEKHLRYTDLDSDFKVLTQKMLPELAKLFGYITVHKQRVVSRALLKTIVEMLGSLEREMLVSSMTDFFYQVLGSVTWHAGQSDLESISSESPPSPKSLSGSKKGRAANPFEVTTVHPPAVPAPFGNPFAHQPAAPTAPSTPVPDPVVAKPPASSRTPAPASAKGGEPGGKKSIAPAVGAPAPALHSLVFISYHVGSRLHSTLIFPYYDLLNMVGMFRLIMHGAAVV